MIWKVKSLKPFPWESCNLLFQLRGTTYSRKRRWVERRPWKRLLACRGLYSLLGLLFKKRKKKKKGGRGGFPGGSFGKESACNVGDLGLIPGLGRVWQPILVFLPRESPWTEELDGLQSMQSQSQTRLSSRTELNTVSFLCKSPSLESVCVSTFPPYKDTSQIGWRLTLMTLS